MAYSITQFENNLQNSLIAIDENFITFGALVPIPCGIAGTNTLTLTQSAIGIVPSPAIQGYTTGMFFTGIAAATNTGAVQAQVGSAGLLNVYKDSLAGPVVLSGNEIVAACAISLRYDAALNSGAGGFHLTSTTSTLGGVAIDPLSVQINNNSTLTNLLSGTVAVTFTAAPGWNSQDQPFTLTGLPPNIPAVGDFMMITSPS